MFDEQFRVVSSGTGFSPVNTAADVLKVHSVGVDISKNGYLYVYCSNESNQDVFFDNLQVIHTRGPLLEETHYYPFGLTMAGISSKAAGKLENRKQYNGIEHTTDLGLNQYDAFYRTLDPQIGRFWQVDPETDNQEDESPYGSMGNNPITNVDPQGDFKTRFGAWLHKLFNGGRVGQNVDGEYFVAKNTETTYSADGTPEIGVKVSYGKGRNALSTAKEQYLAAHDRKEFDDRMVEKGVFERHNTPQEAAEANLKVGVGLLLPNILKLGTGIVNRPVTLPNSAPIMRSLGAASRAEMLARKLKMNINSPTTRQVLNSLDETVSNFISTYRKASIRSEIPGEFLGQTVEQALNSGNTTMRKLLTDSRFVK